MHCMPGSHVTVNAEMWNVAAPEWAAAGERDWASEPAWGQWGIPEADLNLLPADMSGMAAIELGCGTGYVSAWMWRRGATVTGIDVSTKQLATARRLAAEYGADIELLEADAEDVPLPSGSFDFGISEYGAALWCESRAWRREAHRLLRPGAALVFLSSTPLVALCSALDGSVPAGTEVVRDYFGLYRLDWSEVDVDPGGVEFVPTISEWVRIFGEVGFDIADYLELRALPNQRRRRTIRSGCRVGEALAVGARLEAHPHSVIPAGWPATKKC